MKQLSCFKAYDIRSRLGDELDEEIAYRIGRAFGERMQPAAVVVGGDVRATSEALKMACWRSSSWPGRISLRRLAAASAATTPRGHCWQSMLPT